MRYDFTWFINQIFTKDLFNFKGRARRMEYGMFNLYSLLLYLLFGIIGYFAFKSNLTFLLFPFVIVSLVWGLASLRVTVRRFHDMGYSGKFVILLWVLSNLLSSILFFFQSKILMFIVGIVFLGIQLSIFLVDGERRANEWGESPKYSEQEENSSVEYVHNEMKENLNLSNENMEKLTQKENEQQKEWIYSMNKVAEQVKDKSKKDMETDNIKYLLRDNKDRQITLKLLLIIELLVGVWVVKFYFSEKTYDKWLKEKLYSSIGNFEDLLNVGVLLFAGMGFMMVLAVIFELVYVLVLVRWVRRAYYNIGLFAKTQHSVYGGFSYWAAIGTLLIISIIFTMIDFWRPVLFMLPTLLNLFVFVLLKEINEITDSVLKKKNQEFQSQNNNTEVLVVWFVISILYHIVFVINFGSFMKFNTEITTWDWLEWLLGFIYTLLLFFIVNELGKEEDLLYESVFPNRGFHSEKTYEQIERILQNKKLSNVVVKEPKKEEKNIEETKVQHNTYTNNINRLNPIIYALIPLALIIGGGVGYFVSQKNKDDVEVEVIAEEEDNIRGGDFVRVKYGAYTYIDASERADTTGYIEADTVLEVITTGDGFALVEFYGQTRFKKGWVRLIDLEKID